MWMGSDKGLDDKQRKFALNSEQTKCLLLYKWPKPK